MPHRINITEADIEEVAQALGCCFDDPNRHEALQCIVCQDIQACPGSGKTTLLVSKLAILAKKWIWRDRGICVLSHTNVARHEVEKHLANHPAAHRLLNYPHFIGTFQVFVDQFLALPYLRSKGVEECTVDNERAAERACAIFASPQCSIARTTLSHRDAKYPGTSQRLIAGLRLRSVGDESEIDSAGGQLKLKDKTKPTYRQLRNLKRQMWREGIFRYDEMYTFAEAYLGAYPQFVEIMCMRFPWVFIDEMQDTDETQDSLLQQIFGEGCILQRLGDVNQAIFRSRTEGGGQTSFPSLDYIDLPESKRFGQSIATLVSPLTVVSPQALEGRPDQPKRPHTIFLFDRNTITQILPAFGNLLAEEYPDGLPGHFLAKAVGFRKSNPASANEHQLPYNIGDYWQYFQPDSVSKSTRPSSLVGFVRRARYTRQKRGECREACNLLIDGVLELLHKQGVKDGTGARFTKTRLMDALAERDETEKFQFQELLAEWCLPGQDLDCERWHRASQVLVDLIEPWGVDTLADEAKEFLKWTEGVAQPRGQVPQLSKDLPNVYRHESPVGLIDIELATIHAVKGETHTATLVLETYWHKHDLKEMLPFLTDGGDPDLLKKTRTRERIKRAFVGMTRPQELLCLAIQREHLDEQQIKALNNRGWKVQDLTLECDTAR